MMAISMLGWVGVRFHHSTIIRITGFSLILFYEQKEGFNLRTTFWGLDDTGFTRGGLFVDFNRDGVLDLLRASQSGPADIFWEE